MRPTRFDHCLLYGDDIDANLALFTEVLGFHPTERIMAGDGKTIIGTFLSCSNKPHDIAFIRNSEKGRLHHVSFYLESWNDIGNAADILTRHQVPLDIGPTRHGITRGYTIYFFDPSGNRNEVFSGGYQYYRKRPVRPALSAVGNACRSMTLRRALRSGARDGGRQDRDHRRQGAATAMERV